MLYQFFLRVRIKHTNVVKWKIILKLKSASAYLRVSPHSGKGHERKKLAITKSRGSKYL